ncbi:hypothetical protein ACI3L3_02285 [Desulfobaculum sp. SPO524]|uniref:hypothetical protein n=1 Tax=Desulfobaculum sp. SPO524 TaxID=3378071 RepID=UPI0038555705
MSLLLTAALMLLLGSCWALFVSRMRRDYQRVVHMVELERMRLEHRRDGLLRERECLDQRQSALRQRMEELREEAGTVAERRQCREQCSVAQWLVRMGKLTEANLRKAKEYCSGTRCELPLEEVLVLLEMVTPADVQAARGAVSAALRTDS